MNYRQQTSDNKQKFFGELVNRFIGSLGASLLSHSKLSQHLCLVPCAFLT
jgi:hypothetical protein